MQAPKVGKPNFSLLKGGRSLPPSVHLLSLHDNGSGAIILRLAHIFQVRRAGMLVFAGNSRRQYP